jgi:D-glycero-alpha-D-manno-heptose 1-phosphate guanylyltransferase
MEALILAGGFGTRLRPAISDLPKSMADINGRPFLEYLLDRLISAGTDHVILSVGYMHEHIEDYFGSAYKTLKISYAIEAQPLGTGGGIRLAMGKAQSDNVLVLNGDTLFMLDLQRFRDFHFNLKSIFSLALRQVEDTGRYGAVSIDTSGRIIGFSEKQSSTGPGYINAGVYMISKRHFLDFSFPEVFSVEKDFLETEYINGNFYGFPCSDYFIDIGIPGDYSKAQTDFKKLFPQNA